SCSVYALPNDSLSSALSWPLASMASSRVTKSSMGAPCGEWDYQHNATLDIEQMLTEAAMSTIYDFSATDIQGNEQSLEAYRGQVLLVVNVASPCGFTPQYAGLEALYRDYHAAGLAVLGFPCDQCGHQEPGD